MNGGRISFVYKCFILQLIAFFTERKLNQLNAQYVKERLRMYKL